MVWHYGLLLLLFLLLHSSSPPILLLISSPPPLLRFPSSSTPQPERTQVRERHLHTRGRGEHQSPGVEARRGATEYRDGGEKETEAAWTSCCRGSGSHRSLHLAFLSLITCREGGKEGGRGRRRNERRRKRRNERRRSYCRRDWEGGRGGGGRFSQCTDYLSQFICQRRMYSRISVKGECGERLGAKESWESEDVGR